MDDLKVRNVNNRFDSEEIRFNHRFSSFKLIGTPSFSSYMSFQSIMTRKTCSGDISYVKAKDDFESARKILEKISEFKNV